MSSSKPLCRGSQRETSEFYLVDRASGKQWIRMLSAYEFADPEDAEVLEALADDLGCQAAPMGAVAFLDWLEDRLSNVLGISERQTVAVDSFGRVVERLYSEHVEPVEVGKYRTHLPLYTLRAAAGRLGEDMESVAEDWVPVSEGIRSGRDLFVAHVVGRYHGAAHTGWQPEPVLLSPGWLPAGKDLAHRAARRAGDRALHREALQQHEDLPRSERRAAARAHTPRAPEPRVRRLGRGT